MCAFDQTRCIWPIVQTSKPNPKTNPNPDPRPLTLTLVLTSTLTLTLLQVRCAIDQILRNSSRLKTGVRKRTDTITMANERIFDADTFLRRKRPILGRLERVRAKHSNDVKV